MKLTRPKAYVIISFYFKDYVPVLTNNYRISRDVSYSRRILVLWTIGYI